MTSNLDPGDVTGGHVDPSYREHVRFHLSSASMAQSPSPLGPDGLFIGKPVLGKVSGKWTIQMSRKVVGRDGRTLGVVVASLNPSDFEAVYGRVALGDAGSVALVGADRTVGARVVDGLASSMGTPSIDTSAGKATSTGTKVQELPTERLAEAT